MQPAQPGQRVAVSAKADCRIRLQGPEGQRIAVAAISPSGGGRVLAFERIDPQHWFMDGMAELEGDFEIVAYVMDDRHGGFTNAAGYCLVATARRSFPVLTGGWREGT